MRKTIRPKQLIRIIQKLGFVRERTAGSHVHFRHSDGRWATIPVHNKEFKKGTLHAILKSLDLTLEDLG
jgi:predicted RNA binding protein YcfA (HicA-like mRNA interferase family)